MFDSVHDHLKSILAGRLLAVLVAVGCLLFFSAEASACSVCQGDPNSNLVKGAEAGVLLMVAITYGLLLGMSALGVSWFVRQRRRLQSEPQS